MKTPYSQTYAAVVKLFLPALFLPVVIMLILGVTDSLLMVFYNYNGIQIVIGHICFTVIFFTVLGLSNSPYPIIVLLSVSFLLLWVRSVKIVQWIILLVSLYISFFLQIERHFFEISVTYVEFLHLSLNGETHRCITTAIELENGKKLGMCKQKIMDDSIWAGDSPYEIAIIYDSGDQILLPPKQRTSGWWKMAGRMNLLEEAVTQNNKSCIAPVLSKTELSSSKTCMIDTIGDVKSLGGHFYYVYLKEFGG